MIFKHELLKKLNLKRIDSPEGRIYIAPNGESLPSVTTILGKLNKDVIDNWKSNLGEVADRILTQSRVRGTAMHTIFEKYLLNDPNYLKDAMPVNVDSFKKAKNFLDENITCIYGVEYPLYSYELKCAGTTDLICSLNGTNTILDFKNVRKEKKENLLQSYFLQKTCYGIMAEKIYDIKIPQICTVILIDHEEPQILIRRKAQYYSDVLKVFVKDRPP